MIRRTIPDFVLSMILLLALPAGPAVAQEWGQEVQIITRIQYGGPVYTFLDSLSSVLDKNPDTFVRRSEEDEKRVPYTVLREDLYEDGIDLLSATHAFVRYRFEMQERTQLVETVRDIYFIFRFDESESDIPILHVSSRAPVISRILSDSGIASLVNMKAVTPFRELLSFPNLARNEESAMVEIGGRPLRGDFAYEQGQFMEFLMEHTLANGGSYVLHTPDRKVAMMGGASR